MPPSTRSHRVLVVGDANVDLVVAGDVAPTFGQHEQILEDARLTLGASACITASAFARLGIPTALAAVVGRDRFGEFVQEELRLAEVDISALRIADSRTGVSIVLSAGDDRAILTFTGAMALITADDVRQAVRALNPTHVHFAAYFLLPELAHATAGLMRELRAEGCTTSVDTNADPGLRWSGVLDLIQQADVFLPNARELVGLTGGTDGPGSLEQRASALSTHGALVVVKNGERGAFAAAAGEVTAAHPGFPADVLDTTGAGDSFDAAFLTAWLAGEAIATALSWGCAAGAIAVAHVGGTSGQGDLAAIRRIAGA